MIREKEYISSRTKVLLAFFACAMFVGISVWQLSGASNGQQSWPIIGLVLFAPGLPICVWLLFRPQRLVLDADGFTLLGGLVRKPKKVPWRDIEPFFVYEIGGPYLFPGIGRKAIGYNLRPEARANSVLSNVSRRFGADGALPPHLWPGSPDKMVEELNDYRSTALTG